MSQAPGSPARRRGPRTGGSDTRAAILSAAREEFADRGYTGATVRSIGTRAGVDAAMINHYFGGKAGLFQEVIQIPFDPTAGLGGVLAGSREELGRRLTLYVLGVWEQPGFREPVLAILRSTGEEPGGARLLREFALARLMPQVREVTRGSDPTRQVALAMTHLFGIVMGRHALELPPLTTPSLDELADHVAPVIQRYLDGTYRD